MRIFQFVILLVLTSCINRTDKKENSLSDIGDSIKLTNLIISTTELPALQEYYGMQTTLKQKDLIILENEYTKGIIFPDTLNRPIKLLSKIKIEKQKIKAFLEYKKIQIVNNSAFVYYRYDVQGIGIETKYFFRNRSWVLENYKLWEN